MIDKDRDRTAGEGPSREDLVRALQEELLATQQGLLALSLELEQRVEARTSALRARARQQGIVARLGQEALQTRSVTELVTEALHAVADGLGVEGCAVLFEETDGWQAHTTHGRVPDQLAGRLSDIGWHPEAHQPAHRSFDDEGHSGESLAEDEQDEDSGETRMSQIGEDGAVMVAHVPIHANPLGALGVYSWDGRGFNRNDLLFLESVGGVLAAALERTRTEREREATLAELTRSNEDLARFAHVASHDLRAPLQTIIGYCDLLDMRAQATLPDEDRARVARVAQAAERMGAMLDGLLAYSRVRSHGAEPTDTDLGEVADAVVGNLHAAISATGGQVRWDALPRVHADPAQMTQLLQNLVGNGIKFHGDASPRIRISAHEEPNFWEIRVQDNGVGIDPSDQETVFQMFRRLARTSTVEGTGVGLTVCRRIVERHGGKIGIDSEPGLGTTVWFTLPR